MRQFYMLFCAALLCVGCSNDQVDDFFKKFIKAPPSSIDRDVKGHDQIYAVHAILRTKADSLVSVPTVLIP